MNGWLYKLAEWVIPRTNGRSCNYFRMCGSLPSAVRVFQQLLTVEFNLWTTPLVPYICRLQEKFGEIFWFSWILQLHDRLWNLRSMNMCLSDTFIQNCALYNRVYTNDYHIVYNIGHWHRSIYVLVCDRLLLVYDYGFYTSVSTGTIRGEASSHMFCFYERPPPHTSPDNDRTMVSYSHLSFKVDVCLCWEQMIHNFTMVIQTCDEQRRFPFLEVKNGIAHVKCTCRGTRLTS